MAQQLVTLLITHQAQYTFEILDRWYISFGQDPIQGIYQSSYQFWSRVMQAYENGKDTSWAERTKRSDLEFKLLKKQQRSSMHESNNVKMDTKVVC